MIERLILFMILMVTHFSITLAQDFVPLFVGTYTEENKSEGVYVYDFDVRSGEATLKTYVNTDNPSFLAVSKSQKTIYAVNEVSEGTIIGFEYDGRKLSEVNTLQLDAAGPCHISIDPTERLAVISNYSEGSLVTVSLEDDGRLGEIIQNIRFEGKGKDPARQSQPHIHSAFFRPHHEQVFVQDLGTDRIYIYDIDYSDSLRPILLEKEIITTESGGGPRHIAFSADGEIMYALMELSANIEIYINQHGSWILSQTVRINGDNFLGESGAAEIKVSGDGRFLYASDRLDSNIISVFDIQSDGRLTNRRSYDVLGQGPRSFTLSPDEKYLLVANQLSNEIIVFERNQENGNLKDSGKRVTIYSPTCVVF